MSMADLSLMHLMALMVAVLVGVSLIGTALAERRARAGKYQPVLDNFDARVRGWWIMTVLMGLVWLMGPASLVILFALVSMGALREFLTLTTRARADHWAFVASFFVVLPVQYLSIWQGWYGFYNVFVPVYAFLLLPVLSMMRGRPDQFLSRVAQTQWALMVAVFCISHLPAVLFLDISGYEGRNLMLLVFLVLVVQGADLLQHFWSVLAGRTPIAPAISQSRTWEGFMGGVASAGLLGAALFWITPFGLPGAVLMGVSIAAVGGMGRLVMSAIKQDRGVTDWGHMNDGQGGLIDRMDSVIFAAPVFFHLARFFWHG